MRRILAIVAAALLLFSAVALAQEDGQYETTQYATEPVATTPETTGSAPLPSTTALPPPTSPEAMTMALQYIDQLGGRLPETRPGELPSTGAPGQR